MCYLLLTGVLFKGRLDTRITFNTGPFHDTGCRLEDLADNMAIAIGKAFQDRPEFGTGSCTSQRLLRNPIPVRNEPLSLHRERLPCFTNQP